MADLAAMLAEVDAAQGQGPPVIKPLPANKLGNMVAELDVAQGSPDWENPKARPEDVARSVVETYARAGKSFEDAKARLPSLPDAVRPEFEQQAARRRYEGTEEGVGLRVAGAFGVGGFLIEQKAKGAMDRIKAGNPEPNDYNVVAHYERLNQIKQEEGVGPAMARAVSRVPGMLVEFGAAGKVAGAVGGRLGLEATPAGASLARTVAGHGVRSTAMAPLLPSMYLEQAAQSAIQKGGDWADFKNLGPAMGMAALNTMVLGSLQKVGGDMPTALGRGLVKAPIGIVEQQAADAVGGLARFQTGYGTLQDLIEGKKGEAQKHLATQAVTFGLFGAMHGRQPTRPAELLADIYKDAAGKGQPITKPAAEATEAIQSINDLVSGKITPAEFKAKTEDAPPKTQKLVEAVVGEPGDLWNRYEKHRSEGLSQEEALARALAPSEKAVEAPAKPTEAPPAGETAPKPPEPPPAAPNAPETTPEAKPTVVPPGEPGAAGGNVTAPEPAKPVDRGPLAHIVKAAGHGERLAGEVEGHTLVDVGDRFITLKEAGPKSVQVNFDWQQVPEGVKNSIVERGVKGEPVGRLRSAVQDIVHRFGREGYTVEYEASGESTRPGGPTRPGVYATLMRRMGFVEARPAEVTPDGMTKAAWKMTMLAKTLAKQRDKQPPVEPDLPGASMGGVAKPATAPVEPKVPANLQKFETLDLGEKTGGGKDESSFAAGLRGRIHESKAIKPQEREALLDYLDTPSRELVEKHGVSHQTVVNRANRAVERLKEEHPGEFGDYKNAESLRVAITEQNATAAGAKGGRGEIAAEEPAGPPEYKSHLKQVKADFARMTPFEQRMQVVIAQQLAEIKVMDPVQYAKLAKEYHAAELKFLEDLHADPKFAEHRSRLTPPVPGDVVQHNELIPQTVGNPPARAGDAQGAVNQAAPGQSAAGGAGPAANLPAGPPAAAGRGAAAGSVDPYKGQRIWDAIRKQKEGFDPTAISSQQHVKNANEWREYEGSRQPGTFRKGGLSLERLHQRLEDEGFLRPDTSRDDLVQMLKENAPHHDAQLSDAADAKLERESHERAVADNVRRIAAQTAEEERAVDGYMAEGMGGASQGFSSQPKPTDTPAQRSVKESFGDLQYALQEIAGYSFPRVHAGSQAVGNAMAGHAATPQHAERASPIYQEKLLGHVFERAQRTVAADFPGEDIASRKMQQKVEAVALADAFRLQATLQQQRIEYARPNVRREAARSSVAAHTSLKAAEAAQKEYDRVSTLGTPTDPHERAMWQAEQGQLRTQVRLHKAEAAEQFREASRLTNLADGMKDQFTKDRWGLVDRADYEKMLASPEFKQYRETWVKDVAPVLNALHRTAKGLGEHDPIESMTQMPDAPVNFLPIIDGQVGYPGAITVGGGGGGKLTGARQGRYGFGEAFTGAHEQYSVDPRLVIQNSLYHGISRATKANLYRVAAAEGEGVWGRGGQRPEAGTGEAWAEIPGVNPRRGTQEAAAGETSFFVRESKLKEWRKALDIDPRREIPFLTPAANRLTRWSLFALVEAVTHIKNLGKLVYTAGANPVEIAKIVRDVYRGKEDARNDELFLAARGMMKGKGYESGMTETERATYDPRRLTDAWMHYSAKALDLVDTSMRIAAKRTFERLAAREGYGIVKTEQNMRDFINSNLGQYNMRAASELVRMLRQTGIGPFAVAASTMTLNSIRNVFLGSGIRTVGGVGSRGDVMLRAEKAARIASLFALAGVVNYLVWGRPDGDDKTPIGGLKVKDKDGKTGYIDLGDLTGWKRGARSIGLLAAIEGGRAGTKTDDIVKRAGKDVFHGVSHVAEGPGVSLARGLLLKENAIGMPVGTKASAGAPNYNSQAVADLQGALLQTNPLVAAATGADRPRDKSDLEERAFRALGPVGVKFRRTPPGKPLPAH